MNADRTQDYPEITLLILSRDPDTAEGGVATFVRAEMSVLRSTMSVSHFPIGRRQHEGAASRLARLVMDPVRFVRHLRSQRPTIIQLNPSLNSRSLLRDYLFAVLASRFDDVRVATVFHGWDSGLARRIAGNPLLRWMFRTSFGRSRAIVVLARHFRHEAVAMGIKSDSVSVLTTMFDEAVAHEMADLPPPKSKIILFMSRIVAEKGAAELVKAFARAGDDRWPDWRIVIAGDGPDIDRLEKLVRRLRLDDRVCLAGYVSGESKLELLRTAAVFALPTRYPEGLPISVLEAMAAGCALLTSDVGGLGDVLQDGVNGVILSDPCEENISRGMSRLLDDEEFLHNAQRVNHRKAWSEFSSSRVIGKLERLLVDSARIGSA